MIFPLFLKPIRRLLLPLIFASAALALGQAKHPAAVLPPAFNGWHLDSQSVKTTANPATADAADSAVLKEYGFARLESATYTRAGRKMEIRAALFNDATGAYGAFTYYVQPQMAVEKIGDSGASSNNRILFYKGNILVDVAVEHLSAMSAADLRALAVALPRPKDDTGKLPTLPGNLPSQSLVSNTSRYIIGPEALTRLGLPIPAQLVDFSKSPEVVAGKYRTSRGEALVTLVGYPTPQIARDKLNAMQAAALPGGPFYFKRSGPYVVVVSGSVPADEAQSLLASVNYDADVTVLQPKRRPPEDRAGFIVALVMLCMLAVLAALIFGFAFGGLRVLLSRYFPNRVLGRPESGDIIRLDLKR